MVAWSYSSIKTFDQCPKKYYHLKVAKDVKDEAGPEANYGTEAHKAAEDYVKDDTPFPSKFKYMEPMVETLKAIPGDKYCELKLGVRRNGNDYEPCDFFAKDVWWRGIVDLAVVNPEAKLAHIIDYKTGKNSKYADTKQLDLMAGAIFVHFPQILRVKSGLVYVVSNEFIPKSYVVAEKTSYLKVFSKELDRLEAAYSSGVWNANSTPLCGWCPVTSCEHYRKRR